MVVFLDILLLILIVIILIGGNENMHPLEKRLQNLKELLTQEQQEQGDTPYAQDLRLTIKICEKNMKNITKNGFKMVEA